MNSKKNKKYTMILVLAAFLGIASMIVVDALTGLSYVQQPTSVPDNAGETAPQKPTIVTSTAPDGTQTIKGEDGATYTVDANGVVRDAQGNILGNASSPPPTQ